MRTSFRDTGGGIIRIRSFKIDICFPRLRPLRRPRDKGGREFDFSIVFLMLFFTFITPLLAILESCSPGMLSGCWAGHKVSVPKGANPGPIESLQSSNPAVLASLQGLAGLLLAQIAGQSANGLKSANPGSIES